MNDIVVQDDRKHHTVLVWWTATPGSFSEAVSEFEAAILSEAGREKGIRSIRINVSASGAFGMVNISESIARSGGNEWLDAIRFIEDAANKAFKDK